MNGKIPAMIAAFLMVISAAAIWTDASDDSSADSGAEYRFYLELNDGTNSYSGWLSAQNEDSASAASMASALGSAVSAAGGSISLSGNWVKSITMNGTTYAPGSWGTEPYYGFAIYYSDGSEWKATSNYEESTTFAIVFGQYQMTSGYTDSGYGYWTPLPESGAIPYTFYLQLNDKEFNSCEVCLPVQYASSVSAENFGTLLKAAVEEYGGSISISGNWLTSITVDDVTYASGTEWAPPYWGFSVYYADNGSWKAVSTYDEGTTFAVVYDEYQFFDESRILNDNAITYGMTYCLPDVSIPAATESPLSTTYNITVEFDSYGKDPIIVKLPAQTETEVSASAFADALTKGMAAVGGSASVSSSGWMSSITYNGVTYTPGSFGVDDPYYGFLLWYSDGSSWKTVSTYDEGSTLAVNFNMIGTFMMERYTYSGYGYYSPLPYDTEAPAAGKTVYSFVLDLDDGTAAYDKALALQTEDSLSAESMASALSSAIEAAGGTVSLSGNWVKSIDMNGTTYAPGTWGTQPYYGFAIYYSDGGEWRATSNYEESSAFAVVFGLYKFFDESAYIDSGYGYWTPATSAAASSGNADSGDTDTDDSGEIWDEIPNFGIKAVLIAAAVIAIFAAAVTVQKRT